MDTGLAIAANNAKMKKQLHGLENEIEWNAIKWEENDGSGNTNRKTEREKEDERNRWNKFENRSKDNIVHYTRLHQKRRNAYQSDSNHSKQTSLEKYLTHLLHRGTLGSIPDRDNRFY